MDDMDAVAGRQPAMRRDSDDVDAGEQPDYAEFALELLDERVVTLQRQVSRLDGRLDRLDPRFDVLERKLDHLTSQVAGLRSQVAGVRLKA